MSTKNARGRLDAAPDWRLTRRESLAALSGASALVALGGGRAEAKSGTTHRVGAGPKTMGIALGGGGSKGLAHLPILQTLDALGMSPKRVAGTSAGALIGALYAGGISPAALRHEIGVRYAAGAPEKSGKFWERYMPRHLLNVAALIDPAAGEGGLLKGERFVDVMLSLIKARRIEDLRIPLQVVATDYWTGESVVIDRGPLKPALMASMAMPGIFEPVQLNGRLLVDGGLTNPVPFDLLRGRVDWVLAVEVIGQRNRQGTAEKPSAMEGVFQSFRIMERAIINEKRARFPPDVYLAPPIGDVAVLEYYRAEEIYAAAEKTVPELKRQLTRLSTRPK